MDHIVNAVIKETKFDLSALCEFYRSGEWGDHVTLQAAADSVC